MTNHRSILAAADRYGVAIPETVSSALEDVRRVRALNPAPLPATDYAKRILAAPDLAKALGKEAAAYAGEAVRGRLLGAVQREAETAVTVAIRSERDALVGGFLASASLVEAARVLAEIAPTLPKETPRSPSIERDGAARVAKVAQVVAAWQIVEDVARVLTSADLIAPPPGANLGPALLLLDVKEPDAAQALDWTNALHLATSGHASAFGANMHTVSNAERLVPVALAHLGPIRLVSSREEWRERVGIYSRAREVVVEAREVQRPSESWVPNLGPASGKAGAGVVL